MTSATQWRPADLAREAPDHDASRKLTGFVLFQIVCQLALISPIGGGRTLVRAASLGSGLVMMMWLPGTMRRHPAYGWAVATICVLVAAIAHPDSDLPFAAPAQAALYLAIMSPIFWAPRLLLRQEAIVRIFLILWAFHVVGSLVGILQVFFPGSLQPPVSPVILSLGPGYVNQLKITVAGGARIFRPMGLTDIPGGAGASGSYAVLFGVGFFLTSRRPWMVLLTVGSMLAGMTCLYLSQIRSLLVMTGISVFVLAGVLVARRDYRRLSSMSVAIVVLAVLGFRSALSMAHEAVTRRVGSLSAASPHDVYYGSRGLALDYTVQVLAPQYPLGAGLGRWGMMNGYFGRGSHPMWAELQWTGWVLDGGLPLVATYALALLMVLRTNWRLSRGPPTSGSDTLHMWAAVLLGYGVGMVALTFSYPVFLSQTGLEFWLLSAALWTAVQVEREHHASLEAAA